MIMSSGYRQTSTHTIRVVLLALASVLPWSVDLAATTATRKDGSHAVPIKARSPYARGAMPSSAKELYADTFGVTELTAKLAESGQLVRFSYTVTDGVKAAPLGDKASTPYLLDERARVVLQIPQMDKVGQLRQTGLQENGKSYWMVFSNKGNLVKVGHRVSVVIGQVRLDGLVVQ